MLWRHLCLARAWSAAGLLACSMFAAPALAEPEEPAPAAEAVTETVRVLDAQRAGDLALEVRGNGQDKVRIALRNTSAKRLNVVIPPGLVASSAVGQARAGGGFQSMGLGTPTNRPGSFGQFQAAPESSGFQSVPVKADEAAASTVTVPAGKSIEFAVPAVCLNFGLPTPTYHNRFKLVDVDDYTADPRARKALRSLATLGTSHGVAQAAMWNVCNGLPFDAMVAQAGKVLNVHEIALAARFVEALDVSADSDLVERAALTEARVFVEIQGEGALAADATRVARQFEGIHLLGLPVRVVDEGTQAEVAGPALYVKVTLTESKTAGETRCRVVVNHARRGEGWAPLGKTYFTEGSAPAVLEGHGLAKGLDHALAAAFVRVTVARRNPTSTSLKVENRLPFTLANVVVKAGDSSGAPLVPFHGLGVGPARSAVAPIQAPGGMIDRVELNGL